MSPIPATSDVVMSGGGIAGARQAWHLAQRRAGRVTLLEQSVIAAVSGRTAGLVDLHSFRRGRFATDAWHTPWSDAEYLLPSNFGHGL